MRFRSAPSARSSSSSSNRPRDAVISAIAGGARIERTTLRAGISSAARMRTNAARGTLKPNAACQMERTRLCKVSGLYLIGARSASPKNRLPLLRKSALRLFGIFC